LVISPEPAVEPCRVSVALFLELLPVLLTSLKITTPLAPDWSNVKSAVPELESVKIVFDMVSPTPV